jgi:hypothetical protein
MSTFVFQKASSTPNWFQKTGKFIIKYDPTNINLTRADYFMHIPAYTSFISPAGCHIVDVMKGKIFQQPNCQTAVDILKQLQLSQHVLGIIKDTNCQEESG